MARASRPKVDPFEDERPLPPLQKATTEELNNFVAEEWRLFAERLPESLSEVSVQKNSRLKRMARMGIPSHLRGKIWCALGGVHEKVIKSNKYYKKLHREKTFLETVVSETIRSQLDMDVPRTFSTHRRFQSPEGLRAMRRVLLGFAYYNPVVGYCQGLGYLCAALLIHMDEEYAFWALVTLVQDILPPDYFTSTMTGFHADQAVFQDLIEEQLPLLAAHFRRIGMSTKDFSSQWFLCLYLRVLPLECAMRIWDLIWQGGRASQAKILFNVGLALLQISQKALLAIDNIPESAEALAKAGVDPDQLIHIACSLCKVPRAVAERQRLKYRTGVRPASHTKDTSNTSYSRSQSQTQLQTPRGRWTRWLQPAD